MSGLRTVSISALVLASSTLAARAGERVTYRLLPGSSATIDFCLPPCACPGHTETGRMIGWFELEHTVSEPPALEEFALTEVDFVALLQTQRVRMGGQGVYRLIGDFVAQHQMLLHLDLLNSTAVGFDSGPQFPSGEHFFPEIEIDVPGEQFGCAQAILHVLAAPDHCPADVTGDNAVGLDDLSVLLSSFGTLSGATRSMGDLDRDHDVDLSDLARMLTRFGEICS